MSLRITVNLLPSKIYLTLSIVVLSLSLFTSWYYFYSLWLSIVLTIVLLVWAYYFFPRYIFLTKDSAIKKIILHNNHLTIEKNKLKKQGVLFEVLYQSAFLVIIKADYEKIVIFKDAVAECSLSKLNSTLKILDIQNQYDNGVNL